MTTTKSLSNVVRVLILAATLMATALAFAPQPSDAIYPCWSSPCGPGKYICYINGEPCWGERL